MKKPRVILWKRVAASVHDAAMAAVALLVGLLARYDLHDLPPRDVVGTWMVMFALAGAIVFRVFGLTSARPFRQDGAECTAARA